MRFSKSLQRSTQLFSQWLTQHPRQGAVMGACLAFTITLILAIKFPTVDRRDTCTVAAVGASAVSAWQAQRPTQQSVQWIMNDHAGPLYSVGFDCQQHGALLANQLELFRQGPVVTGAPVSLRHRQFLGFAPQWQLMVAQSANKAVEAPKN